MILRRHLYVHQERIQGGGAGRNAPLLISYLEFEIFYLISPDCYKYRINLQYRLGTEDDYFTFISLKYKFTLFANSQLLERSPCIPHSSVYL